MAISFSSKFEGRVNVSLNILAAGPLGALLLFFAAFLTFDFALLGHGHINTGVIKGHS
jgi:hypothetical protein